MKETKKTPNILIRETSRHHNRADSGKLKPIAPPSQDSRNSKRTTKTKVELPLDIRKEFIEAENLTMEEQLQIRKEAQKTANRKIRSTENKIENEVVSMLELECSKLVVEAEQEKMQSQRLRFQAKELRKNIDFLSRRLENISNDNEQLTKYNDCGAMEKGQLNEQLRTLSMAYARIEGEKEKQTRMFNEEIKALKDELQSSIGQSNSFEAKVSNLSGQKQELEEEIRERVEEYEYLKTTFEDKKREWDRKQQQFEGNSRQILDKKGEKISKYQAQVQAFNQKLKQEEAIRKKVTDKNQDLQKQSNKNIEVIKSLEDQICSLKKRVNDLSILKSSNNAILNTKLQQVTDENTKLKKHVGILQKNGILVREEASKPILFGDEDCY